MTHTINDGKSPAFLIVVQDVLVGQDIALTISDQIPDAHVIVVGTMAAADAALQNISHLNVAFVAASSTQLAHSPLAQSLAQRGGQIVLMGPWGEAERQPTDRCILRYPFSTDDVRSLISKLTGNLIRPPCVC